MSEWSPNIPAALLILGTALALYALDPRSWIWSRHFYSAERKKLENVSRWWQDRAR